METNQNAGQNYDPDFGSRLRLQDKILKFIFRSPSRRILKVPGHHFNILKVKRMEKMKRNGENERGKGKRKREQNEHFEGFHWLLFRHWTFDT
ncbi:hypothetical protein RIR_jg40696.t1 [Rhizophagus irregularis DAOM 181602=DAOM 197198]|nr:hypothetical protein RIR_jg40696.t1 [Rhizophagus irregularis DAOM 181602=DAOM 197198]